MHFDEEIPQNVGQEQIVEPVEENRNDNETDILRIFEKYPDV